MKARRIARGKGPPKKGNLSKPFLFTLDLYLSSQSLVDLRLRMGVDKWIKHTTEEHRLLGAR